MNRPTDKQAEHEWIEAYLTGQLPDRERTTFADVLAADPDFNHEVAGYQRTHDLMQEAFIEHDGFQCGYCWPSRAVS